MNEQEAFLKEWIRENLIFETDFQSNNLVKIGLRFDGEDSPFTYEYIQIPNES